MKGYVSHLITENEKLEQELTADYDAAHAPVSHQQLLALQLRGDIDELSVCIHDCVSLVPMVKDLPADLLEEAGAFWHDSRQWAYAQCRFWMRCLIHAD